MESEMVRSDKEREGSTEKGNMGEDKKFEIQCIVQIDKGRGSAVFKEWRKNRWQKVARYRLGNEMRENKY